MDVSEPARNPAELPAHELAAYIVETHHAFLRRELPRLQQRPGTNRPSRKASRSV